MNYTLYTIKNVLGDDVPNKQTNPEKISLQSLMELPATKQELGQNKGPWLQPKELQGKRSSIFEGQPSLKILDRNGIWTQVCGSCILSDPTKISGAFVVSASSKVLTKNIAVNRKTLG